MDLESDACREEQDDAYVHALALVDHLDRMGGASACTIPVTDRAEEYLVIVSPKATTLELCTVREEIRQTWSRAQGKGPLEVCRIFERMVDRLGYGRIVNNPPL